MISGGLRAGEIHFHSFREGALVKVMQGNASYGYAKEVGKKKAALAKQYAPVDTGALKRSIRWNVRKNNSVGWQIEVSAGVPYAIHVEYGTSRGTPAYAYMRRALNMTVSGISSSFGSRRSSTTGRFIGNF